MARTDLFCLLMLAAMAFAGEAARAQPFDPAAMRFTHFTPDDGLPHASVMDITADRRGFLWIGTLDGLARFDGYAFETFRPDAGRPGTLSDGFIHTIREAADGALWVATRGGGVNRFDPDTETFRAYRDLPDQNVSDVTLLPGGGLWVHTLRGTCRLDTETGACPPVGWRGAQAPPAHAPITAMLHRRDGAWWLATDTALYHVAQPAAIEAGGDVALERLDAVRGVAGITALYETGDGSVWMGTLAGGLYRLGPDGRVVQRYHPAEGSRVLLEHAGWLWVATSSGMRLLDPESGREGRVLHDPQHPDGIAPGSPSDLYLDPTGTLWMAMWGSGLSRLEPPSAFRRYAQGPGGLRSNFVVAVAEDRTGALWVGTDRELSRGSGPVTPVLTAEAPACAPLVWAIHQGRDALWVGTQRNGLCAAPNATLDAPQFQPVGEGDLASSNVRAILQDRRGWLWIAHTEAGLQLVREPERWRRGEPVPVQTVMGLPTQELFTLYGTRAGDVWVGTRTHGAVRVRVASLRPDGTPVLDLWTLPPGPDGPPHPDVRGFWEAPDGTLWMATYGGGIGAWHPQRGTRHVGRAEGMPNAFTYGLLPDDQGHLWVPTNNGLARYHLGTGEVRTFTVRDGLQDNEFNTGAWHAGQRGWLYAGGVGGLSAWRPEEVDPPAPTPPVYLTGLSVFGTPRLFGQRLDLLETITLPHHDNFLTLAFTAPALAQADDIRYRYWLEGEDPVPVEAGTRRFAGYTGLAPGRYRFVVEAYHADAPAQVTRTQIGLVITPPWWRTPWFYALVTLVLLGGLVLGIRWASTRKLRARVQALETERRLQAERARISRDLHDHVGAQLTSLVSGLELAEAYGQHGRAEEREETLRSLQGEARHTIAQLRGTIWTLSDEPVPLRRFADQATKYAQEQVRYARDLTLDAEKRVDDTHVLAPAEALHLYRIVQEAVQNTIKHAEARHLALRIEAEGSQLTIEIADDGQFGHASPGSGLRNMACRAEEIGATLHLSTGGGTSVRVVLPLNGRRK